MSRIRCTRAADPLLVSALLPLSAGLLLLLLAALWLVETDKLDVRFAALSVCSYGVIAGLALANLHHHPYARFGSPNVVTTVRAIISSLFVGLTFEPDRLASPAGEFWNWIAAGMAFFAVALDGLDGFLARRFRLISRFGARYDMEVDALLMLLLSALAIGLDKVGPWILCIGLMRYAFVAAGWIWPALAVELPESPRRKIICVMQQITLCVIVTPLVGQAFAAALGMTAALLLAASFAADIQHLLKRRRLSG